MWFVKARRAQNEEEFETWIEGGVSTTLNAFDNATETRATVIVMREREGKPGGGKGPLLSNRSFTLSTANFQMIFTPAVRRLTPTECERLQGFPDGWTEGQADSHRYKQLGNAVAVPVVQWLINRTTGKD